MKFETISRASRENDKKRKRELDWNKKKLKHNASAWRKSKQISKQSPTTRENMTPESKQISKLSSSLNGKMRLVGKPKRRRRQSEKRAESKKNCVPRSSAAYSRKDDGHDRRLRLRN